MESRKSVAVVVLVLVLCALAGALSRGPGQQPPWDREAARGEVYATVLKWMVGAGRMAKGEQILILDDTDWGAVPSEKARLAEGMSPEMAALGPDHVQVRKFEAAMRYLSPQAATLADFRLQNSCRQLIPSRLPLPLPYQIITLQELRVDWLPGRCQLPIQLSGVGFNESRDQALATVQSIGIHFDLLLARGPGGKWKVVRQAGGRFVMD